MKGDKRYEGFRPPKGGGQLIRFCLLAGGILMTVGILLLLSLMQALSEGGEPREIREVGTVTLAPPEPPPPEPPPRREEEQPELEAPDRRPPPLDLNQLEAALNPSAGSALVGGFGIEGFGLDQRDAVQELEVFSLRDLDSRPARIRAIAPAYPTELRRERITGTVRARILIDEEGRVTVLEIVESPDPRFHRPVREALEQWVFEPPMKDGRRVQAQYIQPIPFNL